MVATVVVGHRHLRTGPCADAVEDRMVRERFSHHRSAADGELVAGDPMTAIERVVVEDGQHRALVAQQGGCGFGDLLRRLPVGLLVDLRIVVSVSGPIRHPNRNQVTNMWRTARSTVLAGAAPLTNAALMNAGW